jgi:hypothetical protein
MSIVPFNPVSLYYLDPEEGYVDPTPVGSGSLIEKITDIALLQIVGPIGHTAAFVLGLCVNRGVVQTPWWALRSQSVISGFKSIWDAIDLSLEAQLSKKIAETGEDKWKMWYSFCLWVDAMFDVLQSFANALLWGLRIQ